MAMVFNNHVFKGHRALLGSKFVTYGELELPTRYDLFQKSRNGFDWGNGTNASTQLGFSMLCQLSDKELASKYADKFTNEIVKTLHARDWVLHASDISNWIDKNCNLTVSKKQAPAKMTSKKSKNQKSNVVKDICGILKITQKNLAEILEVPEGTISSWAVKNEIPRLGKKAIEFYMLNVKNQKIVDSYRSFKELLEAS